MEKEQDILFNDYLIKEVFPKEGMCKHGNYKEACWVCNRIKNPINNNLRVLVAMSGGVDSSVATALLKKQGYDVIGVFLKFWSPPTATRNHAELDNIAEPRGNICCNQEALLSARSVADKLRIPFYVLDVVKEFKREVVDYYVNEYDSGRTPNPCVVCNKKIKFGWLLKKAKELGCEYVATGHYARLCRETRNPKSEIRNKFEARNSKLLQAIDKKKDQSYFLWQLDQDQLKHILFPIGDYLKSEVRQMAKKWGLPTAEKKESQNVCFVPDGNNLEFLKKYAEKLTKSGDIVDKFGNVLGRHQGLYQYTIGQRRGLSGIQIRSTKPEIRNSGFRPVYVLKLDIRKNQLVVGLKKELYSKKLKADQINWIAGKPPEFNCNCKAKIRYGHRAENCQIAQLSNCYKDKSQNNLTVKQCNNVTVIFDKPQRAITPGQSVVFYQDGELIGGGIIK